MPTTSIVDRIAPPSTIWASLAKSRVVDEKDERGRLQLFLPAGNLCVSRASGHLSLAMARRWIDVVDPYFKRGVVFETFHDWEELESYDSSARRALTTWVVSGHRSVQSAHFLVASKLVAMGVSAASLATALVGLSMVAGRDRAAFERALLARLAKQ